jgi:hypothetical protein
MRLTVGGDRDGSLALCALVAKGLRAHEKIALNTLGDSSESKVCEDGDGVHVLVPVGAVDVLEGVTDERGVALLSPPARDDAWTSYLRTYPYASRRGEQHAKH